MGNTKSSNSDKEKKKDIPRSTRSSVSGPPSKKSLLNPSQRTIVKYCLENSKDDIAERICRRIGEKKDDFKTFNEVLPKEQRVDIIESLKEFLSLVGNNLMDSDFVQKSSQEFGAGHVQLRCFGFKPDFFAGMADAVTTECSFLDGATHAPSETAAAWSQLSAFVFSNVRDGYYMELRKQRKNSSAMKSRQSCDLSSEGSSREDEARRSSSPAPDNATEASSSEDRKSKEGTPNFLLPPTVY